MNHQLTIMKPIETLVLGWFSDPKWVSNSAWTSREVGDWLMVDPPCLATWDTNRSWKMPVEYEILMTEWESEIFCWFIPILNCICLFHNHLSIKHQRWLCLLFVAMLKACAIFSTSLQADVHQLLWLKRIPRINWLIQYCFSDRHHWKIRSGEVEG